MIVYFSGTGNTRRCAERLSEKLGEELHELSAHELRQPRSSRLVLAAGERLITMFPVYCWGMPVQVEQYLREVPVDAAPETEVWMVATCGDDIGCTARMWRGTMEDRGLRVRRAFSVQMPNTYVCMKGFDVDKPEVYKAKMEAMPARVDAIAAAIASGAEGADDVVPGSWAWLKSYVVRPWFKAFKMSPHKFYATEECTNCGLCQRECPMENIVPGNGGRPGWGNHCALCLRCYHRCPRHAIRWGDATDGKGQV